jgi:hypothetical protein
MASNIQRGPRRMDAGDWVRLKRLGGMNYFQQTNAVTNPSSTPSIRLEPSGGRRVYTEFGTSKIRMPASVFTDIRASRTADYVIESNVPENNFKTLSGTRLCSCSLTSNPKKQGICPTCLHRF